ncbi:GNAT family N-acetyltransferase [Franconibacter daqui]|uniref:GNAT family N-acetyltransferase n=1 Tax=Franconibacter daqui TaxID=2047724 RepID=UPI002DBF78AF|nr:GNAT family N-acetyltransferase [Franconibacter daqui]MEB5922245.1 GNAT family N-acetyltransferase [Franconibacter daqui]
MSLTISHVTLDEIVSLCHRIPEFTLPVDNAALQQRIGASAACALIAYVGEKPAGFKLGYALDKDTFYSWLGGVLPAYRRDGVAQALLEAQETWAKEKGYKSISVKTRNSFPAMLMMLVKNGYQVIELEKKGEVVDYRLVLRKTLLL